MELAVYAPPDVLITNLGALDRIRSEHPLRAVILRSPEAEAFAAVRQRDLEAWWLAPGLWGNVKPPRERQAKFPEVPGWTGTVPEAFESQWRMFCPTDPELPAELGAAYARTAMELDATGIYCTHLRYHHPADVAQLWGCACPRCRSGVEQQCGISFEDIQDFWQRLSGALRKVPVGSWAEAGRLRSDAHPLAGWWASLTDSGVPLRWFEWKNATLQELLSTLAKTFRSEFPDGFFASNGFEPLWAPLVGHAPTTLEASAWYSPLLGYWSTHVRQSALNLAEWHARLADERDIGPVLAALEGVCDTDGALRDAERCVALELGLGSDVAADIQLPYWPVLNGTSEATPFLGQSMDLARKVGARGVVLQGISQLLEDQSLDSWY
jgi:hypothetical protein